MKYFFEACALSLAFCTVAIAQDCNMAEAFKQADHNQTTAVWADESAKSLLFADGLHVNTDGTSRSYKVSDFWGEKDAINNLCNAMSDGCSGLNIAQKRERRIITQDAESKGWPADLLAKTKIPASIIPRDKQGRPCTQSNGFLVSATALQKKNIKDECDITNYVDALTVNAIVIPKGKNGFFTRNARVGDVAVVMSGDGRQFYYAVVGDTGPTNELGEVSVSLAGHLLNKVNEPVNYLEIRGKKPYIGQGWDVPKSYVIVFPGTRSLGDPYMRQEEIDRAAEPVFLNWGGIERLRSCSKIYKRK